MNKSNFKTNRTYAKYLDSQDDLNHYRAELLFPEDKKGYSSDNL